VLRDLGRGLTRFQDLIDSLRGMSPNLLSERLKSLEACGIVERGFYSDHPPRAEYRLTEKGRDLEPALEALRVWGKRYAQSAAGGSEP